MKYLFTILFSFVLNLGSSQTLEFKYDIKSFLAFDHEFGIDLAFGDTRGMNFGVYMGLETAGNFLEYESLLFSKSYDGYRLFTELDIAYFLGINAKKRLLRLGALGRYYEEKVLIESGTGLRSMLNNEFILGVSFGYKRYFFESRRIFTDVELSIGGDVLNETNNSYSFLSLSLGIKIF